MYKIEDFLLAGEKHDASDIHLSTGEHPRLRVKGKLHSLGGDGVLLTKDNILKIMDAAMAQAMDESVGYHQVLAFNQFCTHLLSQIGVFKVS